MRLPLDEALDFFVERDVNISAVDEALEELELVDSRQAQIVELRFFACYGEARLGHGQVVATESIIRLTSEGY